MQQHRHSSPESRSPVAGTLQSQHSGSSIPHKRSLDDANGSVFRQKTKVTRACDSCKAKKSKCSGDQPCQSCDRRGLSCQYESLYLRGRAPTPRPAGTAQTVYSNLSVQQVEDRTRQSSDAPAYEHSVLSRPSIPENRVMDALAPASPPSREPEVVPEVPSRASPGLEVAGQYTDPTSGLSFLHRAWRRISNNESSQVMNGHLGSVEDNQLLTCAGDKPFEAKGHVNMPSLRQGRELLAWYFDVCIATYRLLHRPTVESWLEAVSQNAELNRPLSHGLGRAKTSVVLSVLAVASFHEEKARGSNAFSPVVEEAVQSQSDELFVEATRLTDGETGIPRLESAQSRLIQVLYLLMSCRFNQAWYNFGHTLQIISALGLHRRDDRKRPHVNHKRDYIDVQCRKRTFWVAYTLDKYLGVIFGRPRHYHDEDIDQDFPDSVNDEDMTASGPQTIGTDDCHIDSLVFHAKLAQIAERISREVYSIKPVPDHVRLAASHRLGEELRQWRASLPPLLGAVNPSSLIPSFRRQATALKLSYCHAVMLAHRPFLLKNTTRDTADMRALAKEGLGECILAAESVLQVVDRMAREGRLFHAFWWTHYICFCALVIVYVWAIQESHNNASLQERRSILDQAERCLQHLAQATATNSPSRKYSIILQELRTEAKRKSAKPAYDQSQSITATAAVTGSDQADLRSGVAQAVSITNPEDSTQTWQPLFGSPIDSVPHGLQNLLDDWQTTDWLHLDSSAFGPFAEFDNAPLEWMNDVS